MKRSAAWATTLTVLSLGLAACSLLVPIDDAQTEDVQDAGVVGDATAIPVAETGTDDASEMPDSSILPDSSPPREASSGCLSGPSTTFCEDFEHVVSPFRTAARQGLGIYDPAFDAGYSKPNALRITLPSSTAASDAGGRCVGRGDCQGSGTDWEDVSGPVDKVEVAFAFNALTSRDGQMGVLGYKSSSVEVRLYLEETKVRAVGAFQLSDGSTVFQETSLSILPFGVWRQVRLVHNASLATVVLHLDAVSSSFPIPSGTRTPQGPLRLTVGGLYLEPDLKPIDFLIDDIRVMPLP